MMTDPVADMLTRIRNANRALLEKADIPSSRVKVEIAKILKAEGFIKNFRLIDDRKQGTLRVYLKYGPGNQRILMDLQRVSRPGLRIYAKGPRIPRTMGGLGVTIVSTSKGIMTGREAAALGVGGEVLCQVW